MLNRNELLALLLISVFIVLFLKPVISGDGFGYYAQLEAIYRDETINLVNQVKYNDYFGAEIIIWSETAQKYVTRYPPGIAIFSAPLYMVSLFLDDFPIFHIKDDYFIAERGDILIHQLAVTLTSLIFVYIAFLLTLLILKELNFGKSHVVLATAFFGTPLVWYATYGLSSTHAVEAGLMSVLVLLILKDSKKLYMGILIGLLSIVRYTSIIFALPFVIYYILSRKFKELLVFIAGIIPFGLFILYYNSLQFGNSLLFGYDKSINIAFHVFDIFFNLERGFLVWTPLILIAIIGLFYFNFKGRNNFPVKWIFLSFIALYVIIYGFIDAWHSGWAYGNRYFTVFFPIFAIGIAAFIDRFRNLKPLIYLLLVYAFIVFLLFIAATGGIPSPYILSANIGYWFADGNIANFISLLIQKISFVRFMGGF